MMETVVERPAALDVHKEQVTACVSVPAGGRRREQHVAEFKTTVQGLLALRDWLKAHGATEVAMEASGVYWKPSWEILEDEFDCLLVNARHVKQVPGRKTDVSDAAWLCQLLEAGLLERSFVPPKPIRTLRNLTCYRTRRRSSRRTSRLFGRYLADQAYDSTAVRVNGVEQLHRNRPAYLAGKAPSGLARRFEGPP
jgi:transposase